MSKADVKKNHTNGGKKALYDSAKTGLGHSKSEGNSTDNQFQGVDSRVSPDTPTEVDGGTRHSQVESGPGASPNRKRFAEPQTIREFGTTRISHVSNSPKEESSETRADADAEKVKLFSRPSSGNGEALPRPKMSDRSFSSTGAKSPNQEKA